MVYFDRDRWRQRHGHIYPTDPPEDMSAALEACLIIPASLQRHIPPSDTPVEELMTMPFPKQETAISPYASSAWFCDGQPTGDIRRLLLQDIPVPSKEVLRRLENECGTAWLSGANSITDPRINDGRDTYPLFALSLWGELERLGDLQTRWCHALEWLRSAEQKAEHFTAMLVESTTTQVLSLGYRLPLNHLRGSVTTSLLTTLFSNEWFSTDHMDVAMDELNLRLPEEGLCHISTAPVAFSNALLSYARNRKTKSRILTRYEDKIRSGYLEKLYFPINVNGNHWAAGFIDVKRKLFGYVAHAIFGDTLWSQERSLRERLLWFQRIYKRLGVHESDRGQKLNKNTLRTTSQGNPTVDPLQLGNTIESNGADSQNDSDDATPASSEADDLSGYAPTDCDTLSSMTMSLPCLESDGDLDGFEEGTEDPCLQRLELLEDTGGQNDSAPCVDVERTENDGDGWGQWDETMNTGGGDSADEGSRFGNGASIKDIARQAGISEGSVLNYTKRCFTAIKALQSLFIRRLTDEEKELEKEWVEQQIGMTGSHWRDGWLMYDGTIVVLYAEPGLDGSAYYTRKGNYGLNVQIGNAPTNLRIIDVSYGMTGSAHDSAAFAHTAAAKYPDWLFDGEEFAWTDSAYSVNLRTIPVHKEPASFQPNNALFDSYVSRIRVRSEHCMGALKARFQCLRGLRVRINNNADHVEAGDWIAVCCIIHNLIIDVEGLDKTGAFLGRHGAREEVEDTGEFHQVASDEPGNDNSKRQQLINELVAFKASQQAS
ncbi:hypothetical protein ONZ45_g6524 [Pleurotus djamor]|nr:hypothetical protein ONZ45_g6524 [Pleurotus djamor]